MAIRHSNDAVKAKTPPLAADSLPPDPPKTTATQVATTTSAPVMQSRTAGWHAKCLGFAWEKRADQHRYLLQTGLPKLHAAILNEDWAEAAELLCPEDLDQSWQPPVTQRRSRFVAAEPGAFHWAAALPSTNPDTQRKAILAMAIERVHTTSIGDSGCLLGTNLLTFCLLKPAPVEFLERVIKLAQQHEPQVLSNPDANGRTPLYIAVERGDLAQIRLLQAAGANQFIACHSLDPAVDRMPSAYELALTKGSTEVFNQMLGHELSQWREGYIYPVAEDSLRLADWVIRHDEAEARALAEKFPALRVAMFSYEDKSGSSQLCRALRQSREAGSGEGNGARLDENIAVDPGFDPFIETPSQQSPLDVAAEHGSVAIFVDIVRILQTRWEVEAVMDAVRTFLLTRNEAEIQRLARECPRLGGSLVEIACEQILLRDKDMSADKFMALVRLIWPKLDETTKSRIFVITAAYKDRRMDEVLAMLDCSLKITHMEEMMNNAAMSGNTAAWDFAADRSMQFNDRLGKLANGEQSVILTGYIEAALMAGSLRTFDRMMQAGLDLQRHIDFKGETLLPMLADLDPTGLSARLKGVRLQIDANLASKAKTDAGQRALLALIPANSNSSNT